MLEFPGTHKAPQYKRLEVTYLPPISNLFHRTDKDTPLVIPRACDFFDLSVFCTPQPDVFNLHHKAVILSEAPRRSIAYRRVYGAESKDPGDACWQMRLGAFRP